MKSPALRGSFFGLFVQLLTAEKRTFWPDPRCPTQVASAARAREFASVVVIRRRSVVFIRRIARFVAGRLQVPGRDLCCPASR